MGSEERTDICLTDDQIRAYSMGSLSPREKVRLNRHIRACSTCQDKLMSQPSIVSGTAMAFEGIDSVNRSPCPSQAALIDYVDGAETAERLALISGHIRRCARCRSIANELEGLRTLREAAPQGEHSGGDVVYACISPPSGDIHAGAPRPRRIRWLPVALGGVLLISVALLTRPLFIVPLYDRFNSIEDRLSYDASPESFGLGVPDVQPEAPGAASGGREREAVPDSVRPRSESSSRPVYALPPSSSGLRTLPRADVSDTPPRHTVRVAVVPSWDSSPNLSTEAQEAVAEAVGKTIGSHGGILVADARLSDEVHRQIQPEVTRGLSEEGTESDYGEAIANSRPAVDWVLVCRAAQPVDVVRGTDSGQDMTIVVQVYQKRTGRLLYARQFYGTIPDNLNMKTGVQQLLEKNGLLKDLSDLRKTVHGSAREGSSGSNP